MSDSAPADVARVLGLINAFRHSKAMFTAASLGVFDALETSPMNAPQLATRLGTHAGALERLLNACAYLGLVEKKDGIYRNTPNASRYLVSASPDTLSGYVVYSDQSLYPLWGNLADAIREGSNRWQQTFGDREALFDQFFRDEQAKRSFLQGMHGLGQLTSRALVRAFDFSRFRQWVDLGGATGHLCIAACEAYPELDATVFDLPAVEEVARQYLAASLVSDRLHFVAGDFFKDELPPADLYSLGRILHDWGPEKIARLLTRICRALPQGGALLVGEAVLDDDHTGPEYAVMQSLNMLVCTEGRERSHAEYRELLLKAGFAIVELRRTGTALDAILALKASETRS
jgi:acetylserotonin N-methyltransferase